MAEAPTGVCALDAGGVYSKSTNEWKNQCHSLFGLDHDIAVVAEKKSVTVHAFKTILGGWTC